MALKQSIHSKRDNPQSYPGVKVLPTKVYDLVKEILETKPYTREFDSYLVYEVWKKQMGNRIDNISLVETMSLWKNKKISSPATITRGRREVQKNNPLLLDKVTFEKRMGLEKEIRQLYRK